eukprot:PhM_4_TR8617/c0_g1_i1/m.64295
MSQSVGGAKVANYTFQQPPKSVGASGAYRDPNSKPLGNMMHDRRVVRGNTYAQVVPIATQEFMATNNKPQSSQAGTKKKKRDMTMRSMATTDRPHTPEAVDGRKHIELQTEQYREALTDAIEEATQETQTDPMLDRPPTP